MKLSLEIKKKSLQIMILIRVIYCFHRRQSMEGGGGVATPPPGRILREKVPFFNRLV